MLMQHVDECFAHLRQTCLAQMFESRPIWSKNAVKANFNIHPEKLKLLLPLFAYYMVSCGERRSPGRWKWLQNLCEGFCWILSHVMAEELLVSVCVEAFWGDAFHSFLNLCI